VAEAMNQVQRAATVGASSERRCQSVSGFLAALEVIGWLRAAWLGWFRVAVATWLVYSSRWCVMPWWCATGLD